MQVKSRQRVINHGEVFTAEREVKSMCSLVDSLCRKIDSRFLEPACGEGNFLIEILTRKLDSITDNHEKKSIIALSSIYGIDILSDNVIICREKLFNVWKNFIDAPELTRSAKFILSCNIVCGDFLSMTLLDGRQIIFPEWTFNDVDDNVTRKDFRLADLINDNNDRTILMYEEEALNTYPPANFKEIGSNVYQTE